MSNKTKRVMAAVLAVVLVIATMLSIVTPLFADEIDELERIQAELEAEAAAAQALADATAEELAAAQAEVDAAQAELQELTAQIDEVGARIVVLNKKIEENEEKLVVTEAELAQAREDLKVYYAALKSRIQMMYESDRSSYLEILLNASNISEFFSKLEYISQVVEYDNNIMEQLDACRETIQKSKEAIEKTKAELEADRTEEQKEEDALILVSNEKTAVLENLKENVLAYELMRASQQSVVDNIWAEWYSAEYEKEQIEEERRQEQERLEQEKQEQENQGSSNGETGDGYTEPDGDEDYYDPSDEPEAGDESERALSYGWSTWPGIGNGMLSWPVDCYVLSSLYGPRVHPVTGEYKNHGGIDFCADYGQNIYAAGSGEVIVANSSDSWGGGYGYYVMIQHDNGLTTLYAHCSSITVTRGEYVSAGQTIGYVGSTGLSTGPHLHFEVYDGGKQDPEDYL